MEAWRAGLWLQAMQRQGHSDAAAAERLQQAFSSTRLAHFRFPEGVEAMVRRLQARGCATAIITNGHRAVQRAKLEACQAARLFSHVLVGGEEIAAGCGHEKPHPAVFHKCGAPRAWVGRLARWCRGQGSRPQRADSSLVTPLPCRACRLVGCAPEEAVHVGDSLIADVNGAPAMGQLPLQPAAACCVLQQPWAALCCRRLAAPLLLRPPQAHCVQAWRAPSAAPRPRRSTASRCSCRRAVPRTPIKL